MSFARMTLESVKMTLGKGCGMRRLPALWTHEETAAYLRIDSDQLDRLVALGAGPRQFRVGHYRRYDPAMVLTWLGDTEPVITPRRQGRHAAGRGPVLAPSTSSAGVTSGRGAR